MQRKNQIDESNFRFLFSHLSISIEIKLGNLDTLISSLFTYYYLVLEDYEQSTLSVTEYFKIKMETRNFHSCLVHQLFQYENIVHT